MALIIRKKGNKNFFHYPDESGAVDFSLSNFVAKIQDDNLVLTELNGAKRGQWIYSDVTIYDDSVSGGAETFASAILLFQRLIDLGYPAFYHDAEVVIAGLISTDASNDLVIGTDGLLYVSATGGNIDGGTPSTIF